MLGNAPRAIDTHSEHVQEPLEQLNHGERYALLLRPSVSD